MKNTWGHSTRSS